LMKLFAESDEALAFAARYWLQNSKTAIVIA